ncbi:hypothetical protein MKW98_028126, partial [Papaver atlanticum]
TPLAAVKLVLDLGGKLPWLRCDEGYASSSYKPVKCTSSKCALADIPIKCVLCNGYGTEAHKTRNPITQVVGPGELITDFVTVNSNEWFNSLHGLAKGAQGVAGLGRSSGLSLVSQFSAGFRFSRIFALDFGSRSTDGKIFFGGGPYYYLSYTQLLINPKCSEEYFIDLKSIKIHGETVPIVDKKLLVINKTTGVGGTKVNFRTPYTILQTSIYRAITKVHLKWAKSMNITMVPPIAPFGTCNNVSTIPSWPLEGDSVPPSITFMFPENELRTLGDTVWIEGTNASCLAFIDGGLNPKTSIVIGEYNLNFFVEFQDQDSGLCNHCFREKYSTCINFSAINIMCVNDPISRVI